MRGSKLIAFNSLVLYIKMIASLIISLFTTRIVINALGIVDYGIYALIIGVIVLLSFLNSTMTLSTQRFISFSLGSANNQKLNKVVNTSVIVHFFVAFIILLILFFSGIYFFNNLLNIPTSRIAISKVVYNFLTISTVISIINVPFTALINSYEHFLTTSIFDITGSILKLLAAIYLLSYGNDRLLLFGFLIMIITLITETSKSIWSIRFYKDVNYNFKIYFDKQVFFELINFAGWNTFGSVCNIGRNQGVAILLNIFFGATVNAAYGVANQINSQIYGFSSALLNSFNPQILKSEGSNDRSKMINLAVSASKFSFFMLAFLAIPVIIELPVILKLWLVDVPENTVIFGRIIILVTLINQLGSGLPVILQAVGKIKWYQITVGSLVLLIVPIGYVLLINNYPAYYVLYASLIIEIPALILRMYFANIYAGLDYIYFLKKVINRTFPVFIISFFSVLLFKTLIYNSQFSLILILFFSSLLTLFLIFNIGLTKIEKEKFVRFTVKIYNNRIKKYFYNK